MNEADESDGAGQGNGDTEEWKASLGEMIKQGRQDRYSIEELAKRAGVSSGRISQIERGTANPSFETLWRLATALELPIGSFFESSAAGPAPQVVVRKGDRKRLVLPYDDLEYELLTPDLNRSLEVFIFHVPPGFDNSARPLSHKGEECIHVLVGELEVHVSGTVYELKAGDTATYNPSSPHYVCNRTDEKAVALAAITPPSF